MTQINNKKMNKDRKHRAAFIMPIIHVVKTFTAIILGLLRCQIILTVKREKKIG